jgi:nitrite reductase/ring-hydroxylating ferredoxin subunit
MDDDVAVCPQNWYLLAYSHELARGVVLSRPLGDAEVVLFRGAASGQVSAFLGHCAHMGCHLKHGRVVGDGLRCALHHRLISADGYFLRRDGSITPDLRQPGLPTVEQYGCIFVFAGAQALFDLPRPFICREGSVQTACLTSHVFELPWLALTANGMDIEHLQAVHDRKLMEPPILTLVDAHCARLTYVSEPVGHQIGDRITKYLAKGGVRAGITCMGGSMLLVESNVGNHKAFIILSMIPAGPDRTIVRGVVGVPARKTRLASVVVARAAAWLFQAFLKKDIGILQTMSWHEPARISSTGDDYTKRLYAFMRTLPAYRPEVSRVQR